MDNIIKVYSGKAGKCMCGCAGKYSYTTQGALEYPENLPVVNERSVKVIAGKVMRNPLAEREDNYLFVEENGRILVVYFAK